MGERLEFVGQTPVGDRYKFEEVDRDWFSRGTSPFINKDILEKLPDSQRAELEDSFKRGIEGDYPNELKRHLIFTSKDLGLFDDSFFETKKELIKSLIFDSIRTGGFEYIFSLKATLEKFGFEDIAEMLTSPEMRENAQLHVLDAIRHQATIQPGNSTASLSREVDGTLNPEFFAKIQETLNSIPEQQEPQVIFMDSMAGSIYSSSHPRQDMKQNLKKLFGIDF
jgi:hypothetical protein